MEWYKWSNFLNEVWTSLSDKLEINYIIYAPPLLNQLSPEWGLRKNIILSSQHDESSQCIFLSWHLVYQRINEIRWMLWSFYKKGKERYHNRLTLIRKILQCLLPVPSPPSSCLLTLASFLMFLPLKKFKQNEEVNRIISKASSSDQNIN